MMNTDLWFMFPLSIAISTIAMMAGIGGAVMYSPLFLVFLRLKPETAFASGLVIELFGFSSGLWGYWKARSIDIALAKRFVLFSAPATILGVALARFMNPEVLKLVLAGLLFYLAYALIYSKKKCCPRHPDHTGAARPKSSRADTQRIPVGEKAFAGAGGLLMGMVSSGLGEVNEWIFLKKRKMPVPLASGTSVFLVAASALLGVAAHSAFMLSSDFLAFEEALSVLLFSVPGVIIGAPLGVAAAKKMKASVMKYFAGFLFLALGIMTAVFG